MLRRMGDRTVDCSREAERARRTAVDFANELIGQQAMKENKTIDDVLRESRELIEKLQVSLRKSSTSPAT
ncbi:hypothetical protein ABGB18_32110 [Nonomuraea sp. B12E4]|uniref:hypothetical protein n=1 Tax=Nonomuraea sp. B12E4 TaxID=3153564 RepID=UPI00325EF33A